MWAVAAGAQRCVCLGARAAQQTLNTATPSTQPRRRFWDHSNRARVAFLRDLWLPFMPPRRYTCLPRASPLRHFNHYLCSHL